jgi:hypothetical protein
LPKGRPCGAAKGDAVDRRLIVLLFFGALALCALVTKAHVVSWNDGSRIATVDALTADRTFWIDGSPYAAGLGDEIRFRGRTYSDKPPLLAILGALVATAVAPLGITLRHTPGTAIYLVTLFTVGVWFAIGCCYAYALQRALGFGPRVALAVAALSGSATLALPYATVMTNHVPCGAAALAGCFHLYRSHGRSWRGTAAAGAFFGVAYAFDAAGAVYAVAAAVLLWGAPWRRWLVCALAALPVLALQFAYNLAISGSILPTVFNMSVWSDPSLPLHTIGTTQVLRVFSPAEYAGFAVDHLVGVRGIIPFTPIALLAGYGLWRMSRTPGRARVLALAVAATFVTYLALIVFLQNDTFSRNFGERRYADLFFALCTGLGPALTSLRGAWARGATLALAALSIASAGLGTVAPFGGRQGEWGFAFASHELAELQRRAPFQVALDVVFLIALVALVLRLTAQAMDEPPVSAAAPPPG